ncbi:hypothetical protein B6N60_03344 [Richelia sinica FACHB-800]|uniref:Uncharacterized protein n=1 Tax=Richelia sinica FACHB-800 TaxID=1357546 RepID=A0A975TAV2_9NOST|nr:hypothetical protein B6N60_03344 [Richelia sinica FACHB-800]
MPILGEILISRDAPIVCTHHYFTHTVLLIAKIIEEKNLLFYRYNQSSTLFSVPSR